MQYALFSQTVYEHQDHLGNLRAILIILYLIPVFLNYALYLFQGDSQFFLIIHFDSMFSLFLLIIRSLVA